MSINAQLKSSLLNDKYAKHGIDFNKKRELRLIAGESDEQNDNGDVLRTDPQRNCQIHPSSQKVTLKEIKPIMNTISQTAVNKHNIFLFWLMIPEHISKHALRSICVLHNNK